MSKLSDFWYNWCETRSKIEVEVEVRIIKFVSASQFQVLNCYLFFSGIEVELALFSISTKIFNISWSNFVYLLVVGSSIHLLISNGYPTPTTETCKSSDRGGGGVEESSADPVNLDPPVYGTGHILSPFLLAIWLIF